MLNNIVGLLAPQVAASTNSYESIQTVTVGAGGQSTISFTAIPSTYKHLQIRYIARASGAVAYDFIKIRFNSDTTSNYSWHVLRGDGANATAGAGATQSSGYLSSMTGSTALASTFSAGVTDVLDYTATNKAKTVKTLGGYDANGVGAFNISLQSSAWYKNTSSVYEAVTSIDLTVDGGSNFAQYSSFALYGIKG